MTHLDITQGIARLTLESPPVNALSEKLLNSIGQALDSLELRDDWSVLTLASRAGAFCAGGDLHAMAGWMQQSGPERAIGAYAQSVQRIAARIEALPQVTIALCERSALGGGLELALACDLRVASSRAKFGLPEVRLGLLPGAGGTQRLTRLCGVPVALRLILGAEIVDADMARQFGLVQWVFKADCFEKEAQRLAARYAAMPRQAQQASKSCIRLAHERHAGFQHEIEALSTLCATQETRHLVEDFLAGAREGDERK